VSASRSDRTLGEGRFLRLVERDGWELVERPGVHEIAVVVAVSETGELVLIEQHRPPVGAEVLELPAGLVGDEEAETLEAGARRELLEETGYLAATLEVLTAGPTSAGLTSEVVTLLWAPSVRRVSAGGGTGRERIRVHAVPVAEAAAWMVGRQAAGTLIDPKVWAGLWFAEQRVGDSGGEAVEARGESG
jgi:ADP-ribose pyrophosphatase